MDTHVRYLGILSIAFGITTSVLSFCILVYFGGFTGLFNLAEDQGLGFVAVFSAIAHLILGLPIALVAVFVLRWQDWARSVMIFLCGINILNPPFGSMLAIYGLWVLMRPETEPLFLDPPNRPRKPKPRPEPED